MVEILVPQLGESVSEATIAKWFKQKGESVIKDDILVELETDKVTLEVNAPETGVIEEIAFPEGETVEVGQILGKIKAGASASANPSTSSGFSTEPSFRETPVILSEEKNEVPQNRGLDGASPTARKIIAENSVDVSNINGTGKDGRITKQDAVNAVAFPAPVAPTPANVASPADIAPVVAPSDGKGNPAREERIRMSKLRQVIAKRLKDSQNTAAILTTFNEIDMSGVMNLRAKYKDNFAKHHGIKLGFMSFFVKAAVQALKEIPAVNAEIEGTDIIYKNHYDIGVAVGAPQGLVVPVLRDSDKLSFADIENSIINFGQKAKEGKLGISEMQGGTFTISNGGVYGSLLSTPIINPPQSGILGLHKIEERPVVVNKEIVIRPMMYIALSYDHRIIDGKEAVTFLVRIKELIEDPARLVLDI